jgi:neuronal guanine nucleotide exchange factor
MFSFANRKYELVFDHIICKRLLIGCISQFSSSFSPVRTDDSDHHYESLYSIQQQRAALEGKLESAKPLSLDNGGSNQNYFIDKLDNDDDYSSFESDDEEERGAEGGGKQQADLRSTKLPEPPLSNASGQVYAIVQRLKNFGSISKIEITKGFSKITKKRASLGKMPTSKFYETTELAEDVVVPPAPEYAAPKYDSKSIGKKSRGLSKLSKLGRMTINKLPANFSLNEPPFDQSDCHQSSPKENHNESNSSLNKLSAASDNDVEFQNQKNNKSFKAKFRKSSTPSLTSASTSNIYSSLASKHSSTFYVTDSLDVDSGIFAVNEKSTSSPDNSNLNLTSSSSNSNISCDPKRRSIASITNTTSRPKDSPPPPPSERARRSGATSWYAECGLFKPESEHDEKGDKGISSWYQESGLYQTSNNSVAR